MSSSAAASAPTSTVSTRVVPVPLAIRVLFAADLALAAVYVLDVAWDRPAGWFASRFVNLTGENNLPTWYSSAQLLVLALLLGLFAWSRVDRRAPRSWLIAGLPLLAGVLSLDEVASIHEWIGRKSDVILAQGRQGSTTVPRTGIWMLLLGPPFLVAVAVLWRALAPSLRGRWDIIRLYAVGMATFAGSALGLELLSNLVAARGATFVTQVVAEELGEMLGVTVLIWATLALLDLHGIRVLVPPEAQPIGAATTERSEPRRYVAANQP